MSLPELCIRRPVMTTLLMLSFIVFGIFGYSKLAVSALPRVDFPTIADGVYGMAFIETAVKSGKAGARWMKFPKI